jgi:hypothetical protein
MIRRLTLTCLLGAAALMALTASDDNEMTRSGYIIASS